MKLETCPLCNSKKMKYVRKGKYETVDKNGPRFIPGIEFNRCLRCGEIFLSDDEMEQIEKIRKSKDKIRT